MRGSQVSLGEGKGRGNRFAWGQVRDVAGPFIALNPIVPLK